MYPKAYKKYLILFHSQRDYFECHEVLEDYWKQDPKGERKRYWVGLIQLAVTLYHYRRNNIMGAKKMILKTFNSLTPYKFELTKLGIDFELLLKMMKQLKHNIDTNQPFSDINIPLIDQHLIQWCKDESLQKGLTWCIPSPMTDHFLINKHKLR